MQLDPANRVALDADVGSKPVGGDEIHGGRREVRAEDDAPPFVLISV